MMRSIPLLMAALTVLLATSGSPVLAEASRRPIEKDGFLVRPTFALLGTLGPYGPTDSGSTSAPQLGAGLRYLRPDRDDRTWHSIGVEATASTWSSSTEDIFLVDVGLLLFYPTKDTFQFDHHFFYGFGAGNAIVSRTGLTDFNSATGYLMGGLQGRIRDWYLEGRLKYVFGPRRSSFDLSGLIPQVAAVYHFDP